MGVAGFEGICFLEPEKRFEDRTGDGTTVVLITLKPSLHLWCAETLLTKLPGIFDSQDRYKRGERRVSQKK